MVLAFLAATLSGCMLAEAVREWAEGGNSPQSQQVAQDVISIIGFLSRGDVIGAGLGVLGLTGWGARAIQRRARERLKQEVKAETLAEAKQDPDLSNKHAVQGAAD